MKISQREARRLQKRVKLLEEAFERQRRVWSAEYYHATEIAQEPNTTKETQSAIRVARLLGHAVVVVSGSESTLRFLALPHAKP